MIEIIDCLQGSDEWFAARCGIPSASEFGKIIAVKKDAKDKLTRTKYLYRLAAEIITGEVCESYSNLHMERGKEQEPEARDLYAFLSDEPLTPVGFILDRAKGAGCSPDSFVGDRGLLEIKTRLPDLLVGEILRHEFPPEHKAQMQGQLYIAERDWNDLALYSPGLPLVRHRVRRDEPYIADLAKAVDAFNAELAEIVERVKRYSEPAPLKAALTQSLAMAE